ncbi:MAG: GFA family protein [Pseudomonadota bacterium]
MSGKHTGSCLCSGVAYEVTGPLREVIGCHCEQCRKTSGHHVAATRAAKSDFRLTRDETLTWYVSSDMARRGFCNRCGGNLFWERTEGEHISIMAGTLNLPTNLPFKRHIFVEDKADYVTIPPQDEAHEGYSGI